MWFRWVMAVTAAVAGSMTSAVDALIEAIDDPVVVQAVAERGGSTQVTPVAVPTTTPYRLPVPDGTNVAWNPTHSSYPATDLFATCGTDVVSPVWGTVIHVRRVDAWDPGTDNPATRGGRSVAIEGFDGVRYYFAHFASISDSIVVGAAVELGDYIGALGDSGRTSACHLHFAISPPCPAQEWSVRRGVVWPYPYLDAWARGEQLSPRAEVETWEVANPNACAEAAADPYAGDAG